MNRGEQPTTTERFEVCDRCGAEDSYQAPL